MGGVHALFEQRRRKLETSGDQHTMEAGSRVRAHFRTTDGTISQDVWDGRVLSVAKMSGLAKGGQRVLIQYDMGEYHFSQEVPRDWIEQEVDVMEALEEIGILDDAQHYWTMILSASEQHVVKSLSGCQRAAIDHVRTMATQNHRKALPELISRTQSIGINEEQLWAMLTWIRDCAQIIVHIRLEEVGPCLESDTHYRNQFETNVSNGKLCADTRTEWERDLFGGSYDNAEPFQRPKYGILDVMNDHRGVVGAYHYGDSYLVLKNARLRCTFSPEDSGGMCGSQLAVLDQYAHVLLEYADHELQEVARVASAPEGSEERIGDSFLIREYKEAQIHGEIDLKKHVSRLVANERHHTADAAFGEAQARALCHKHGWELVWMNDERARRLTEERRGTNAKCFEVNWSKGVVVGSTEVPDIPPAKSDPSLDVTLERSSPAASRGFSGTSEARWNQPVAGLSSFRQAIPAQSGLCSRSPVFTSTRSDLSQLSGRAVRNGLGSLSKAERNMLYVEWSDNLQRV